MTPKEKAEELLNKYQRVVKAWVDWEQQKREAKQCALIAVDEVLKSKGYTGNPMIDNDTYNFMEDIERLNWDYWQEVKQEILNL